jgi:hypothetical protein
VDITIDNVANEAHLRHIWKKEVRHILRSLTFREANLTPDALAYAAYEWGLGVLLKQLSRDLRRGSYVPEKAEIVRSAKATGLSRPRCFLTVRDAIVYRAITYLVRSELTREAREYVAFLRAEKGARDNLAEISVDSFDWFMYWLQREGKIAEWVNDDAIRFIVESDIANFYPSIRIDAIREHLHAVTSLNKEVVRLCVQLIDGVMPRTDYSEVSMLGLPQEVFGASREIAHSLLLHVDQEFEQEGRSGRFTRFMDDIMVGVESTDSGEACISRLQRSLETLGLYPNASKTKVTSITDFLRESMAETNAELERLEAIITESVDGDPARASLDDAGMEELKRLSEQFRIIEQRPRRWDRVMRRFYTVHRRLGITDWWEFWLEDLRWSPGSAAQILEYVRSWPLDFQTVESLRGISMQLGQLYLDLSILPADTIALAPVSNDQDLWNSIGTVCLNEAERLCSIDSDRQSHDRAATAWAVAAYKYGNEGQRTHLLEVMRKSEAQSPLRDQGLAFHVAHGRPVSEWISTEPGMTAGSALNTAYLRNLLEKDERAEGVALNLLMPQARLAPLRYCVAPRALALLDTLGHSSSKKLQRALPAYLRRFQRNEERLRDHRTEWCFSRWSV